MSNERPMSDEEIIPRVWTSPRTAMTNKERARAYDQYALQLSGETSLLTAFIKARQNDTRNKTYDWKTSISDFIKYHPTLNKYKSEQPEKYKKYVSFLNSFKNLEEIQKRIDSNRDTRTKASAMSHRLRFTVKPKGGKKYRKHKTSKHKSSKHKTSKHKSSKHKSRKSKRRRF
jgi:hypothetical protein